MSRLPHTRSDAFHSAVNASLTVAPYLGLRSCGVSTLPAQLFRLAEVHVPPACDASPLWRAACLGSVPPRAARSTDNARLITLGQR